MEVGSDGQKTYVGIIGCYNSILGNGISELLKNDSSFYIMGVFSHCDSFLGIFGATPPDFCLVDSFFLKCLKYGAKGCHYPDCKILLVEDIHLTPKELHSLVATSNISGIIYKDAGEKDLRRAIFKVLSGEFWFKRETYEALYQRSKDVIESRVIFKKLLTPVETKIVRMICQGLKNREVAEKLFISENTVKSHLYHIYKKFNITSRTELMKLYMTEM